MSQDQLETNVLSIGLPKFTAKQITDWISKKHVTNFSDMQNISKANREKLNDNFDILPIKVSEILPSSDKSAIKYIFELAPHMFIEAVVLQEKKYKTLCISSQCGCPVDCKFCLTGVAGFKKNLTKGEILAQLLTCLADDHNITHVVFMGMGEPLLNYDNVIAAINTITSPEGFGLSKRNITVSTSGFIKTIQQLIDDEITLNLAFSVGSPNPIKRVKFMPVEKQNPIVEVAQLLKRYLQTHNRKLTLEYTLLKGANDTEEDARELANLACYLDAKVNLINLNPHPKIPFEPVSERVLKDFKNTLRSGGVPATIRYTKGQDIIAACGQLGESIL